MRAESRVHQGLFPCLGAGLIPGWTPSRCDAATPVRKSRPCPPLLFTIRSFEKHITGPGCPERPARYDAVIRGLDAAGLLTALPHLPPRSAARKDLLRCHTARYLTLTETEIRQGCAELSTGDTEVCEASWDVARLAAGAGLAALDELFAGKIKNAFCIVRPPGHHASRQNVNGMWFCILTNIAIAARYAQANFDVKKVLIADWDVHHGNGTQDIFYDDPSVFFFSTHQVSQLSRHRRSR